MYTSTHTSPQTWVHHLILWGSIVVTFIFNMIYMAIDTKQNTIDTYWVLYMAATNPTYWFVLLVTPIIALLPRYRGGVGGVKFTVHPIAGWLPR